MIVILLPNSAGNGHVSLTEQHMPHERHDVNGLLLAKDALNFLSSGSELSWELDAEDTYEDYLCD